MWLIEQLLPSMDTIYPFLTSRATRGWGDEEFSKNTLLYPLTLLYIILGYRDKLKAKLVVVKKHAEKLCSKVILLLLPVSARPGVVENKYPRGKGIGWHPP